MSLGAESEQEQFRGHEEWFQAFLDNTTQKRVQELTALHYLQAKFPNIRERIVDRNYPFKILFIGGGTGQSEAVIAYDIMLPRIRSEFYSHLRSRRIAIFYEDPSPQMHGQFRQTCEVLEIDHAIKGNSRYRFEDPRYRPRKMDSTMGFQMWGYVKEWQGIPFERNSLVKLARTVHQKKGVALLSLPSKEGDLHKVRGKHIPRLHGHDDIVAEHVTEELQRLQLVFEMETVTSKTNVISCFEGDKFAPNKTGRAMLSFMLRQDWETLDTEIKEEVQRDVERLVRVNRDDFWNEGAPELSFRDNFIFIPGDQDILMRKT